MTLEFTTLERTNRAVFGFGVHSPASHEYQPMQIEIVNHAGPLVGEWWDLWRRDPFATPFQSPAWLIPWRACFDEGETVVLCLRQADRLMGLLPLFRLDERLLLWGAGTSDRLGGLFDPAVDRAEVSRALAALASPLDLFQLAPGSLLVRSPSPDGWQDAHDTSENCAVLALPAHLPARMRQNLRYYRRRAERAGVGKPELVGSSHMQALADLHARRWAERGEPGVFSDPRFLAWQVSASRCLEQAGLLRLYAMRLESRMVAALYVLSAKGKAFYYIGGFDPGLASLGLGTVLVGHAIEEAEREGLVAFDFLRGQEDYKYRWGAVDEPTHARRLAPVSMIAPMEEMQ